MHTTVGTVSGRLAWRKGLVGLALLVAGTCLTAQEAPARHADARHARKAEYHRRTGQHVPVSARVKAVAVNETTKLIRVTVQPSTFHSRNLVLFVISMDSAGTETPAIHIDYVGTNLKAFKAVPAKGFNPVTLPNNVNHAYERLLVWVPAKTMPFDPASFHIRFYWTADGATHEYETDEYSVQ